MAVVLVAGSTLLAMPIVNATPTDVSEEPYEESVPEEGDTGFEAVAEDGSWISYHNERDEYRTPYVGDGSGKLCVTLLNEVGESIVGETVPNTTVQIDTGDSLEWHSGADPMVVEYPLTDHYSQPLDADQFGTSADLPQGDGMFDSHCIEWHGLEDHATVEYGEVELEGEHADDIEVVGYIQQAHEAWDSDVDPIAAAESYEEAGGGWTYETEESHGQLVVVLQLEEQALAESDDSDEDVEDETADGDTGSATQADETADEAETTADDDSVPGFGLLAAALAVMGLVTGLRVRSSGNEGH